ncbi:MAG: hypothetical protein ACYC9Q_08450 [Bacillota bacterium]
MHDPVAALVYSSGESNICTTVVAGRVVLEDGVVKGVACPDPTKPVVFKIIAE